MRSRGRADPVCSIRPSTTAASIPATSRVIRRGSARMGPSTPTRPSGSRRPPRSLGQEAEPTTCSACSTRSTTPTIRMASSLQGRALCRGRRRLQPAAPRRPGGMDLVHRIGRLALPGRPRVDPGLPEDRQSSCPSTPASRRTGLATNSRTGTVPRPTGLLSRIQDIASEGSPKSGSTASAATPPGSPSSMTARPMRSESSWVLHENLCACFANQRCRSNLLIWR